MVWKDLEVVKYPEALPLGLGTSLMTEGSEGEGMKVNFCIRVELYRSIVLSWVYLLAISCNFSWIELNFRKNQEAATEGKANSGLSGASSEYRAEALAIGNSMIGELVDHLQESTGLSRDQAVIVGESASKELEASVGSLTIESNLLLTNKNESSYPIYPAAKSVIKGAIASLGSDALSHIEGPVVFKLIESIVTSSFGSLKLHISGLSVEILADLTESIVNQASGSLLLSGLDSSVLDIGVRVVSSGSISGLQAANIDSEDYLAVYRSVVSGSITGLPTSNMTSNEQASAISFASKGAIEASYLLNLDDEQLLKLSSELASTSVSSLNIISIESDTAEIALNYVAKEAIGNLQVVSGKPNRLSDLMKQVVRKMLVSVKNLERSEITLNLGVSRIVSGVIAGSFGADVDINTINSLNVPGDAIKEALAVIGEMELDPSGVMDIIKNVMSESIGSLAHLTESDNHTKIDLINGMSQAAMDGFRGANIVDASQSKHSVKVMSEGMILALPSIGFKNEELDGVISDIAGHVFTYFDDMGDFQYKDLRVLTNYAIQGIGFGIGRLANDSTLTVSHSLSSIAKVTEKALEAMDHFRQSGLLSESDYPDFSADFVVGLFEGVAVSGVEGSYIENIEETISKTLSNGMVGLGVSEHDIDSVKSILKAKSEDYTALADNIVSSNFVDCLSEYGNDIDDDDFLKLIINEPITCKKDEGSCPSPRRFSLFDVVWQTLDSNDKLCQMTKMNVANHLENDQGSEAPKEVEIPSLNPIGLPTGASSDLNFTIKVSGANIDLYRYKWDQEHKISCSHTFGYKTNEVSQDIKIDLTEKLDGKYKLCLYGGSYQGFWQDEDTWTEVIWTKDTQAPSAASVNIENNENYTNKDNVTLGLSALDASEVYVTNNEACESGGSWQAYMSSIAWELESENQLNSVYVKFRDAAGNESDCVSDSITHDNIPPSSLSLTIHGGSTYITTTNSTLSISAIDAVDMYFTNEEGCGSGGAWEQFASLKNWTLGQTNSTATVYFKARDEAGNESSCLSDTIIHDTNPPSGTGILINNDDAETTSTTVNLSLTATDASEMYVTNAAGCDSGGSWEDFSSTKSWNLGQTNETATVYVKYRDIVDNESACISDTIEQSSLVLISPVAGAWYTGDINGAGDKIILCSTTVGTYWTLDSGENWSTSGSLGSNFRLCSLNEDASVMATVRGFGESTNIYVSSDFGSTWTPRNSARRYYFMEVSKTTGRIFSSYYSSSTSFQYPDNLGATWTTGGGSVTFSVYGAAANDGNRIILQRDSMSNVAAFVSSNSGSSFTTTPYISGSVRSARIARNNGLYMARASSDHFVVSSDGGSSWTNRTSVILSSQFSYSYDGSKLFIVDSQDGKLYLSTDNAATISLVEGTKVWKYVVSNQDGTILLGLTTENEVYLIHL